MQGPLGSQDEDGISGKALGKQGSQAEHPGGRFAAGGRSGKEDFSIAGSVYNGTLALGEVHGVRVSDGGWFVNGGRYFFESTVDTHQPCMYNTVRSAPAAVCWGGCLYDPGFPARRRLCNSPQVRRRSEDQERKMKYAIVESGGKQYKAVEGATIEVDRLPVGTGENVKLEQVLLLADGDVITVGKPLVKDTPVWVTVVEHFRGEKVTIFNYRPKKRIRVKIGHRQNYTRLLVEQIGGATLVKKAPVQKAEPVEENADVVMEAAVEAETEVKEPRKPARKAAEKPAPAKTPTSSQKGKSAPKKTAPAKKAPAAKKPAAKK